MKEQTKPVNVILLTFSYPNSSMSYFEFLIAFLLPPIVLINYLNLHDQHRKRKSPGVCHQPILENYSVSVVAVLHNSWDNYLAAVCGGTIPD
jgi:hypothetical protein